MFSYEFRISITSSFAKTTRDFDFDEERENSQKPYECLLIFSSIQPYYRTFTL